MLISCNILPGYKLKAIDGDFGTITDLLFDDENKMIRYFVVNCGGWLNREEVLLSPVAFEEPDHEAFTISTILSKHAIEDAPAIESNPPVSKQSQSDLADYFDWPMFWSHIPEQLSHRLSFDESEVEAGESHDMHLRSLKEIRGYTIKCNEGDLGHVEELIVDTDTWTLRYLTIDTGVWLPGKKVIIGIDWLSDICWEEQSASIDLSREQVKDAPIYNPRSPINREYETKVYDYYGRPTYWSKAGTYSLYE
ncbi:PRC-barrel domain protein [Polystyrenella longa]|uniref:PRC-barrel domain protein n=1 Tax=Polystyrenella longa TaxID=2528007 RepID=A0A518CLD0_9PLAN|nr:PRC-barrel domain-containing protein [Polystyrenella longa]QDU80029.1 PRC-barrel domain protein [Polystyrenella longa]